MRKCKQNETNKARRNLNDSTQLGSLYRLQNRKESKHSCLRWKLRVGEAKIVFCRIFLAEISTLKKKQEFRLTERL